MRRPLRFFTRLVLLSLLCSPAWAQFGQNKVAYDQFDWLVYHSPHFDVHYYESEADRLEDVVSYAESAYLHISKQLDFELRTRVPIVMYKTHSEFEQTNIVLQELPAAVQAFAEPFTNVMVFPVDLPPEDLYSLIAHELTHIFEYAIFFDGSIVRTLGSNAPLWLMEGLASYMAEDETSLDQMAIRDAVVNNILPPIQALNSLSFLTYRYGHAIFAFIEQEHGIEGLRSFIFEFRKVLLTGNMERAIQESFGYDVAEFNRRFNRYLRQRYFPILLEKKSPDDHGNPIGPKRPGVFTFAPTISSSGELVAALSSISGRELDLVVFSATGKGKLRNLTKGWTTKYESLVAEAFDGKRDLSWSPTSDQVALFVNKERKRPLFIFDAITGRKLRTIHLDDYAQSASPSFSPDGSRIAFESNRNGVVDIFELDLASGEIRNLTQDRFFDANPWYSADGKSLLYNRKLGTHWKIFSVDIADTTRKTQITFGLSNDLQPSLARDGSSIFFSSDRDDYEIYNIYELELATGTINKYTDVTGGAFAPVEIADRDDEPFLVFVSYDTGTFQLYRMPIIETLEEISVEERLSNPVEAEPFQPSLQLKTDEDQKEKYRTQWEAASPSITVGLTDDGTVLSNSGITFQDLLGDKRISVSATSVSSFANISATYVNFKRRYNWGARIYDFRDYFVIDRQFRQQTQRFTGADTFIQFPFNRYYRTELSVGYVNQEQAFLNTDPGGNTNFQTIDDAFIQTGVSLTGDTTRFQSFGPFQGKRFKVGVDYGYNTSGDFEGDYLQYSLDFRAYKQLTRRSVLAWRVGGVQNTGERELFYNLGGINQLRGFDFRDFVGSNIVYSNLELRFPLIDELRFPFGALRQIRGFIFFDVGGAWLADDKFFDPVFRNIRGDFSDPANPTQFVPLPFSFWDDENDRLQDGRASYGGGLQFFFLGNLQLNWAWSKVLDYTQYLYDPTTFLLTPVEVSSDGFRGDFYIVYDW
jgi:Tol biopolymer transport system component